MTTISLTNATAERLAELAGAAGITVDAYVDSLISLSRGKEKRVKSNEFIRQVEELSIDGPTLPDDFSRDDIYLDHD